MSDVTSIDEGKVQGTAEPRIAFVETPGGKTYLGRVDTVPQLGEGISLYDVWAVAQFPVRTQNGLPTMLTTFVPVHFEEGPLLVMRTTVHSWYWAAESECWERQKQLLQNIKEEYARMRAARDADILKDVGPTILSPPTGFDPRRAS